VTVSFTRSARRIFGVGVLIFTVAAIGGCSGDQPAPTFTPRAVAPSGSSEDANTSEPSPDPTEDDKLPAPALPPEIADFDLDGAEAVARYYLAALDYGYSSNDSYPMQLISRPTCGTCARHIAAIDDLSAENARYVGGAIRYEEPIERSEIENEALIVFRVTQDPSSTIDAEGTTIFSGSGTTVIMEILLHFENEKWRIEAVSGEEVE